MSVGNGVGVAVGSGVGVAVGKQLAVGGQVSQHALGVGAAVHGEKDVHGDGSP